jgi:nitrogen fixation NifU-like protein
MMSEILKGKRETEADAIFDAFHHLVTGGESAAGDEELLDKLAVFAGVRDYPVRVKCATLAWHTLEAALAARDEVVSTE